MWFYLRIGGCNATPRLSLAEAIARHFPKGVSLVNPHFVGCLGGPVGHGTFCWQHKFLANQKTIRFHEYWIDSRNLCPGITILQITAGDFPERIPAFYANPTGLRCSRSRCLLVCGGRLKHWRLCSEACARCRVRSLICSNCRTALRRWAPLEVPRNWRFCMFHVK